MLYDKVILWWIAVRKGNSFFQAVTWYDSYLLLMLGTRENQEKPTGMILVQEINAQEKQIKEKNSGKWNSGNIIFRKLKIGNFFKENIYFGNTKI